MVLGFFRHVYSYFAPEVSSPAAPPHLAASNDNVQGEPNSMLGRPCLPLYDQNGALIGFMQAPPATSTAPTPPLLTQAPPLVNHSSVSRLSAVPPTPGSISAQTSTRLLYEQMPDGSFVKLAQNLVITSALDVRDSNSRPDSDSENLALVEATEADLAAWDGWPDGDLRLNFSFRQFRDTKQLQVNWAMARNGGDRKGQAFAETWEK
ncbi:hypothetical protein DXG01_012865, partial [Tephrocybe rancida]